jgi:hypothetical protein
MAMISIACPDCTADSSMPAQAMLATLDLGGFGEPVGRLSWAYLSCGVLVTAELQVEDLLRLATTGVLLLEDEFGGNALAAEHTDRRAPTQLHAEQPGNRLPGRHVTKAGRGIGRFSNPAKPQKPR